MNVRPGKCLYMKERVTVSLPSAIRDVVDGLTHVVGADGKTGKLPLSLVIERVFYGEISVPTVSRSDVDDPSTKTSRLFISNETVYAMREYASSLIDADGRHKPQYANVSAMFVAIVAGDIVPCRKAAADGD